MNLEMLVREVNPAPLDSIPGPDSLQARRLVAQLTADHSQPPRWLTRRSTIAGLGAAAAAVAATVVVVTVSSTTQVAPASAASVLIKAAQVAAAQTVLPPLGSGQYYYEKTVILQNCSFGWNDNLSDESAQAVYLTPTASQFWTTSDGSGSVESAPQGPGHFQTAAEQMAWAKSGAPNECIEPASTTHYQPSVDREPGIPFLPSGPTTLAALIAAGRVTDAGQLRPGTGHCPSQNGESTQVFVPGQVCSVAAQFDIVNNLLELPEASHKLGPVLYRILAQLPGVEIIGTRTDALGRTGTAIEDPSSGDVVVLDTTTGALLEIETLSTTKLAVAGVPAGSVLNSTTFGDVRVVNADGTVPN
jgi:hypothetical protein